MSPAAPESCTSRASSSSENVAATSSLVSTRNSFSSPFAKALTAKITGRSARERATSGGPSSSALRTGSASATFFGTISPSSMCRYVARVSAMTKETAWPALVGTPTAWNTGSSRCAIAGSATMPSTSVHSVMPSWAAASSAETCSSPHRTLRARRSPCSACGSIWLRRTEISANSAPTKKAFTTSVASPISSCTAVIGRSSSASVRCVQQHAGGAPPRGVDHVEPPAGDLHGVPLGGDAAQLGGDETGQRLVRAVGHPQAHPGELVGAGRAVGRVERAALLVGAGRCQVRGLVRVVLVPHLADDLLDDVLQGGDARRAAVLVDDDGHRAPAGQPVQQPVHGQRLRHEQRLAHDLGRPASAAGCSAGTVRTSLMWATPTTASRLPR